MSNNDDVIDRLDRIAAILQLAHRDEIERARTEIRSDKVNAAVLDASTKWVGAGAMQSKVATKTRASTRTIQDRIADLLATGVLDKRGGGPTTEYKASGLI
jgi:hypothetical protein